MGEDSIQLFDNQRIRTAWDETREEWLFSVVDVVGALAEADNPRRYWSDLKRKNIGGRCDPTVRRNRTVENDRHRRQETPDRRGQHGATVTHHPIDSVAVEPESFSENHAIARQGGSIAGEVRKSLEAKIGKPVITSKNAAELNPGGNEHEIGAN